MKIRTHIIRATLAVVAVLCASFLVYVLREDDARTRAQLQERIERTHARLLQVIPDPLYDGNVGQLERYFDAEFRDGDLQAITLTEMNGGIRVARERTVPAGAGRRLEQTLVVMRGGTPMGEVRTVFTTVHIERALEASRNRILLFSAILMAAVALVVLLVSRGLTRPIERLTLATRDIADGTLDRQIEASGASELAMLGQSLGRMRDSIRQQISELAENNRRLEEEADQRRRVEQERDRLASILEATTDIVSMADPAGNVIYFNRAGRATLGVAPQGPLELMIPQVHPEWAARLVLEQGLPTALRDGVWSGETAILAADGGEITVSQVIITHRDADGRVAYMSTIMRDISERKRTEQALREFNAELERRVEQRTTQLAASRDEADRANHAKSEFLSRMSHELRTPMNAILGFGQLLEVGASLDDRRRGWLREIMAGGRHLLELINDVLDLARVESGKFTISPESVALRPLIDDCLTLLRPLAEAGDVRLLEATRHCDVQVRADRTRLKQVLLNLLSNAVKYNRRRGTVNIVCVIEATATPPTVQVRITDSGQGLTPEEQARLFVPFERLHADERQIEGTGIGLVLSRKLLDVMGGEIGVESAPGSGSTFWIRLPVATGEEHKAVPPPAAAARPADGDRGRRHDVLCIEDNPANLRLIARAGPGTRTHAPAGADPAGHQPARDGRLRGDAVPARARGDAGDSGGGDQCQRDAARPRAWQGGGFRCLRDQADRHAAPARAR